MCLFIVDGTWSHKVNNDGLGFDSAGNEIGSRRGNGKRTNCRRFYDEYPYPENKKFYFAGPRKGPSGNDSVVIYQAVMRAIQKQVVQEGCTEISMIGWSRGAVIVSEIAQSLGSGFRHIRGFESLPRIKFIGLFDAVSRIWRSSPFEAPDFPEDLRRAWGDIIPSTVQYFAHVTASERRESGIRFIPANPTVFARINQDLEISSANHGDIGEDRNERSHAAYNYISLHANRAGVAYQYS